MNGNITTNGNSDLVRLAIPSDPKGGLVSETLSEIVDLLELATALVARPQDLVDDSALRSALTATLFRAGERAKAASEIAFKESLEARQAGVRG
jgi:hypothetical protein